ncbi:MAG: hypothetical protein JWN54_3780 [Mycobacterium sp.]|nr:hypothetical protein [Mycobacterium sp.]
MSDPVAVVLASLPDYGQLLGLAAVDLHGLDGPRYYAGLGFAPVPGNPHGLVRLQDGAELLADEAARAAGALDSVRDVAWEGADAAAFRSRVAALPPVLLRYATALRQFSVLADDAHAALRTGKGRAEALDREAVAVKASLVSSGPLTLPGEVARLVHLLGEGVELYRETRARLTELGLEMEALSRQLPRGPDTAVSRWVDTVADATGYLDRTFGSPITHAAVDAHPAEAHLVAGLLGDLASIVAVVPHPVAYGAAAALGAGSFTVDQRLYRRGATNMRGEAIVTRAEYLAAAATAVPLPAVGPETRGAVRAVTQATEQARRTDEVLAGGPPETPLQRVSAVATATGSPFVPPVLDYLDDSGVGSGRRAAPDVRVRVRTAGPSCRR